MTEFDHFKCMKRALEQQAQSPHHTHKVGAFVVGTDSGGQKYEIGSPNFWPKTLLDMIGKDTKLGNASTTVHAEIGALLNARGTESADLYVTELPCPNCAKAMAEARIRNIYIDTGAADTPLGKKMRPFFETISLPICSHAGINVHLVSSKQKTIKPLVEVSENSIIPIDKPIEILPLEKSQISEDYFQDMIRLHEKTLEGENFVLCLAKTALGAYFGMIIRPHIAVGIDDDARKELAPLLEKYSLMIQPMNRTLINAARYGFLIEPDYLYSAHVPTSREFVNLIGAGHAKLRIGNHETCRDEWGLKALRQIEQHGIMTIT